MRFDLDHDWHGSISTPSATMGERAKNKLLIVLCAIWLIFGLIGHSPWKPFESESISIIKQVIVDSEWLTPTAASQQVFENPPLYYIAAGLFAKLTSPLLSYLYWQPWFSIKCAHHHAACLELSWFSGGFLWVEFTA